MAEENRVSQDEEELRRQIRAEIEEHDRQRQRQNQERETVRLASGEAEKRRKIYQEELQRYYKDKPGYSQVTREDGEIDWVPEAEVRRDAKLFDEVLEDPDEARGRMRWIVAAAGVVIFLGIAVIYLVLHESTGAIQVTSNVPRAQVILDTTPLDRYTDALIREIPAGDHVVTVALDGYQIQGEPVRRIKLKGGKTEALSFLLAPDSSATSDSASSNLKPKGQP